MPQVTVVEGANGTYTVTVEDRSRTTTHSVRVPSGLPRALGCEQVPVAELIRCSFAFLLAREPATSILRTFSLEQIGDYFPDYTTAIGPLVAGGTPGPD
jgi:hypothetical protein